MTARKSAGEPAGEKGRRRPPSAPEQAGGDISGKDPQAQFHMGARLHQDGKLLEAETLYRQVLEIEPEHPDANHLVGVIAHQTGENEAAVQLILNAIRINPHIAAYHMNLGTALKGLGRLDDAVSSYEKALAINPDFAEAHFNLGVTLKAQGRLDGAVSSYRKAITLRPDYAAAHSNLGAALQELGRLDDALASYRQAIAVRPNYAEAHNNLGHVLKAQGRFEDAVSSYQSAIAVNPDFAEAHFSLGVALEDLGRPGDALASHRRALEFDPKAAETHSALGNALQKLGRMEEALTSCRTAIEISPDYVDGHHNLGIALLLMGRFEEGWEHFEWRKKIKSKTRDSLVAKQTLRIDGAPLEGKTILLYTEQGYGDTFQFARYASEIAKLGAKVVVVCEPKVRAILESVPGIYLAGDFEDMPDFHYQAPLMSLPYLFGTTLESISREVPYLWPRENAALSGVMAEASGKLKVGLAWAGNPNNKSDKNRSIPLNRFESVLRSENVRFFSLQVDARKGDIEEFHLEDAIVDLSDLQADFSDTASAIERLDLVVSVDTSVAHLAGAMGKPVWTLLPWLPDWRWMLGRADSPWYPAMRLYRQDTPGDWPGLLGKVREDLEKLAGSS